MINIVIVDDHKLVRTGIKRLLEDTAGLKIVGEAGSGEEAINVVKQKTPDVVLLDIRMTGLDGLAITHKLSRFHPKLKIVIITSYANDVFPTRIIEAGASGYLVKGSSTAEMIDAIRTVMKGKKYISPEIAIQLALNNVGNTKSPFEDLSDHELQVMLMVAQGMKVNNIAKRLHLSSKTVNSYRYRIFKKLKLKGDVALTHYALEHGLIDSEDIN